MADIDCEGKDLGILAQYKLLQMMTFLRELPMGWQKLHSLYKNTHLNFCV